MKFSVIIPTYNRAYCLIQTINSVLNQNYVDFEIVIIDDASTDNTLEILKEIQTDKLIVLKNKTNQGCNISKNNGASIATGKYLIFLDSDDTFYDSNVLDKIFYELTCNSYPELAMFSSINFHNKLMHPEFSSGFVNFQTYFTEKCPGEFLPVVQQSVFIQNLFIKDFSGGEGITWKIICKKFNRMYFSNTICRNYNDLESDRLSFRSKRNSLRIIRIYLLELKVFYRDYLVVYKFGLLKLLSRIFYNLLNYIYYLIKEIF